MKPAYLIPLVPQDLRQEENILQIADVLDHLNSVITDVFRKIDERIEKNAARTRSVVDRIAACSKMVEKLTDTNKATKIYCSAKYPAMDCHRDYQSVFSTEDGGVLLKRTHKDIKKTPAAYSEKELQDKLEFYHVKLSCPTPLQALAEGSGERGRGGIPPELGALGTLLVWGTTEPAYGGTGRPGVVGGAPQSPESPGAGALHAAPATVARREHQAAPQYLYSPDMGEVPSLDVPQDLPHLAGVAGDMRFSLEAEPTIAPSAQRGPAVVPPVASALSLPQNTPPPASVAPIPSTSPATVAALAPPSPAIVAALAPPPPAPVVTASPTPPPPPPPPPPPGVSPSTTEECTEPEKKTAARETQPPVATSLDSHASLMDAIRKAGGSSKARLRSTASADHAQPSGAVSGITGDLMADLHARLSMRRKGISGSGAGGTILAAISAIVPPPAPREPDTRSNSELSSTEEDWD